MNRDHAILCVLSKLNPAFAKRSTDYESPDGRIFSGIQSNEAAVKHLLERAKSDGFPITEIDYLLSEKCSQPDIQKDDLPDDFQPDQDQQAYTSEDFFITRIKQYCTEHDIAIPTFNPIDYDPEKPASSLDTLAGFFNENSFRVSIDITGGPRDAAVLLTLAIEVLKLQSKQNELGPIVYAFFDADAQKGMISNQDYTFSLTDLIHATEAFMDYGHADKLVDFFSNEEAISHEARELCKRMKQFADALAICQISDIEQKVSNVHRALDWFIKAADRKREDYTTIYEQLRNDSLDEMERTKLETKLEQNRLVRGELLFASLAPTIKAEFIPVSNATHSLLLDTIQWCAEHQMIQQALCIFRERMSEVLADMGYLKIEGNPPYHKYATRKDQEKDELEIDSIKEMLNRCHISEREIIPYEDCRYFSIDDCNSFRLAYLYYAYFRVIRNRVMHIDIADHTFPYKTACKYFGVAPNEAIKTKHTREMLIDAVSKIRNREAVTNEKWTAAFKKKRRKGKKR